MRIGFGIDVHTLVKGRKLIIGGVEIENILGLLGHSDADVLIHAIMDALLGAAGLGDIGMYFPPSEKKWEGISSLELLKIIRKKICEENRFKIINIDSVIIAQKPKFNTYFEIMRTNISDILKIERNRINIKATTSEGLGYEGREEGIRAEAVALLEGFFEP